MWKGFRLTIKLLMRYLWCSTEWDDAEASCYVENNSGMLGWTFYIHINCGLHLSQNISSWYSPSHHFKNVLIYSRGSFSNNFLCRRLSPHATVSLCCLCSSKAKEKSKYCKCGAFTSYILYQMYVLNLQTQGWGALGAVSSLTTSLDVSFQLWQTRHTLS